MTDQPERRRQDLIRTIENLEVLPTLASIPLRILQLQRNPSAKISDFVEVLSADVALCTKVLSFANSAWFTPARPITKVSEAITMIGLRQLVPLVLASAVAGIYDGLGLPFGVRRQFWEASLLKGVAARECARHYARDRIEEAFVCGMMQDVVLPILCSSDPDIWPQIAEILDSDNGQRREREASIYGADHGELGACLAHRLGLPEIYQRGTRVHHDGPQLRTALGDEGLARSLEFAALLPHRATGNEQGARKLVGFFLQEGNASGLSTSPSDVLDGIERQYNLMLKVMGCNGTSDADLRHCIQAAGRVLAREVESLIGGSSLLRSALQTLQSDLRSKVEELESLTNQSHYDGLTGSLTRNGFLSRTKEVFDKAAELGLGCAIGFVDLDNFKAINDRYGHAVGDHVLRVAAESLQNTLRPFGLVGRFGGDEFIFLVSARQRSEATAIIDRTAEAFNKLTVTADDVSLRISASIGLLWLGTPNPGQSLDSAIRQADKCMYEAKRSGGARYVLGDLRPEHHPDGTCPSQGALKT